jgi:tRNA A-37 threonylcarbamoyl transferase component Bud32/tetratricopeptide (TPR) repeat protein
MLIANRYQLLEKLGEGGMGTVHAALDTLLERRVAIKMLPAESENDSHARARFRREALSAAALDHPFICKIHEVGEQDGRSFIVMEHIEGKTLDAVIAERRLGPRQLLDLASELAQALDEAHRHGIVHRDLKPSNVMLTVHGHVKVLDFGLAKHAGSTDNTGDEINGVTTRAYTTTVGATHPGVRLGTPSYMSPEQVLGSPLDTRSDIFSLGVVLHELASGRHPFRKDASSDTMAAILRDSPASTVGDLDIVPGFGSIVYRMLAKACAERYQTTTEVLRELDVLRDRGSSGASSASGPSTPFERDERTPLVARDTELGELVRRLDQMLLGHGSVVLLGGEPGVGKTRLARELQRAAHARGCFSTTGQCYEQEGAPPFGPYIEMMDQAIRTVPQGLRSALGDDAAVLSVVFPALRRRFADLPEAPSIPSEQHRLVLFNAYLDYFRRGTAKSPVVMLLDDLHWADDSTLQLLQYIAPHVAAMRLLVVGTYRDVELDEQRPFARTMETLLRQRLASRLSMKRLSATGVEQMLSMMSGATPPASLVKAVYAETDGNPFFVEEVFQHLKEEGRLFDADGRWRIELRVEEINVPEGVRLVISRRLARLGDEARKVLAAAAVIGRSFPIDVLDAIVDIDEDAVLDIVEQSERAQLLQAERSRDARYTFVHELIRSTLLNGLSIPRRQRMHLKIGDAIERLRARSLDSYTSVLAHHLYQAGAAVDSDRAVRVLTDAMQRTYAAGAFEETLDLAERLLSYDLPPASRELAAVETAKADALWALGRLDQALESAERAFVIWEALHDDAGISATTSVIGGTYGWRGQIEGAIDAARRALPALSPAAVAERGSVKLWSAGHLIEARRFEEGHALLAEVRQETGQPGRQQLLPLVVLAECRIRRLLGQSGDVPELARRALSLFANPYDRHRGDAFAELVLGLWYSRWMADSDQVFDEAEAVATRIGHVGTMWVVSFTRFWRDLARTGDLAAFQREVEKQLQRPLQWPAATHIWLSFAACCAGDADRALRELKHAREKWPSPLLYLDGMVEGCEFALHAWLGRYDDARSSWSTLRDKLPKGNPDLYGRWNALMAASPALLLIGDRAACAGLHPALEQLLANGYIGDVPPGPTWSYLSTALAAWAANQTERADQLFAYAFQQIAALQLKFLDPPTALWHGRYLSERGPSERDRAIEQLRRARDGFAAFNMPVHEAVAVRWLAEIGA